MITEKSRVKRGEQIHQRSFSGTWVTGNTFTLYAAVLPLRLEKVLLNWLKVFSPVRPIVAFGMNAMIGCPICLSTYICITLVYKSQISKTF